MSRNRTFYNGDLSYDTIIMASYGDPDAVQAVLKHYERYILALSVIRLYDEDGTPCMYIDETLRRELELRLVTKVVGFRFRPAA
jgi:hypothetical protein